MHSATQAPCDQVIDLASLETRCLGNVQLVERVLQKFTVQLEGDLATLQQALETRDADAFRATAHRLKGMSANVEAWPLHQCAKEAEELAASKDVDDLAETLERLQQLQRQVSATLRSRR
jgi:HPt (histidine-containing phosphotransfer) domain-containing protein